MASGIMLLLASTIQIIHWYVDLWRIFVFRKDYFLADNDYRGAVGGGGSEGPAQFCETFPATEFYYLLFV